MKSTWTWKVVLGCILLFVCICVVMSYYLLDVDNIQCRIRNLIIDIGPAQTRFTELQRAFTSAIQSDELVSEDRSHEAIEVIIGELYCGCKRGWTVYVYRTQQSAKEVLERFANDIHVSGWHVHYTNAEWVDYRNEEDTAEATIRIRSQTEGMPTLYGVDFTYSEPDLGNCWEMP